MVSECRSHLRKRLLNKIHKDYSEILKNHLSQVVFYLQASKATLTLVLLDF